MKQMKPYSVLLLYILLTSGHMANTDVCIEIKDRKSLPAEIYTSLKSNDAILIGEIHGTNEAPQFVEGMIHLWLSSGEKVLLGLEINHENQSKVDSFLTSGDFNLIRNMPFFNRPIEDGRSSAAMADLIKSMYKINNCEIICFDAPMGNTQMNRDSFMSRQAASAISTHKGWKMIALMGNAHNKMYPGNFGYPMGYWLANSSNNGLNNDRVTSLDIVSEGGTSWICSNAICEIHVQGNYAGYLGVKSTYDNSYVTLGEKKFLFTKSLSASIPLNK